MFNATIKRVMFSFPVFQFPMFHLIWFNFTGVCYSKSENVRPLQTISINLLETWKGKTLALWQTES